MVHNIGTQNGTRNVIFLELERGTERIHNFGIGTGIGTLILVERLMLC